MPLPSPPSPRKLAHTRTVTCRGYEREDGLWDIEGQLVDTKPFSFPNRDRGGRINAGEAIHEMWVRLTIDLDLHVHDAVAVTDASPYRICPEATATFQRIVGLRIGPGWNRKVKERLGGAEGCTHVTELLGPLATTAYQTLWPAREKREEGSEMRGNRKAILDTCHALRSDGPVVKLHWPELYRPAGEPDQAVS